MCGYQLDANTHIGDPSVPKPGDVSICAACGQVGVFNDKLEVVEPTLSQMVSIMEHCGPLIERAQALIRLKRRS